jgi:hypothetical protein
MFIDKIKGITNNNPFYKEIMGIINLGTASINQFRKF